MTDTSHCRGHYFLLYTKLSPWAPDLHFFLFLRSDPAEFDQYVHTFQSQPAAQPRSCIVIRIFQLHPSWALPVNKHSDDRIYRLTNQNA